MRAISEFVVVSVVDTNAPDIASVAGSDAVGENVASMHVEWHVAYAVFGGSIRAS